MPGPKYVTDFEFPAEAGFHGSRADRVAVRPHVRRYAEGGRVTNDETKAPKAQETNKGAQKTPAPQGDTIVVPKVGSTADSLKNLRARQMKELGLKKGGKVTKSRGASTDAGGTLAKLGKGAGGRKYAEGGAVLGHAAVQRSLPTTQEDADTGGKGPLQPNFKKGGTVKYRAPGEAAHVTRDEAVSRGKNLKKMNKAAMGGPIKLAAGGLTTDAKDSGRMAMTKNRKMRSTQVVKRAMGGQMVGRGPIRPNIPSVAPQGRRGIQPMPARGGVMMRAKGGQVKTRTAVDKQLGIPRVMPASARVGGPGKGRGGSNY